MCQLRCSHSSAFGGCPKYQEVKAILDRATSSGTSYRDALIRTRRRLGVIQELALVNTQQVSSTIAAIRVTIEPSSTRMTRPDRDSVTSLSKHPPADGPSNSGVAGNTSMHSRFDTSDLTAWPKFDYVPGLPADMSTISLDISANTATKTLNIITVNTVNTANIVSVTAGSPKHDHHTVTRTVIDSAMHDGDDVAARDATRNKSVRMSSEVINDVISMPDVFKLIDMMLKMLFNKAPPRSLLQSSADLLKISTNN